MLDTEAAAFATQISEAAKHHTTPCISATFHCRVYSSVRVLASSKLKLGADVMGLRPQRVDDEQPAVVSAGLSFLHLHDLWTDLLYLVIDEVLLVLVVAHSLVTTAAFRQKISSLQINL